MATAYLARWSGPVSEAADPYGGASPTNLPVQKHVQDVSFLPDRAGPTDNDNIKAALTTYGAVYTTIYIVPLYPAQFNMATNAYYYPTAFPANHGVAIVGWNDAYSRTNFVNQPPGDGAFIVKNSWGTSWGDQGYFYVSYYDANIGKDNAVFTAQPTTNYDNIYQYDPLGDSRDFGEGGSSEWGANVFTATASGNLAAVSFYTLSLNAPYEVYVYTDPTAGPINPSGYAAHVTGTIALPGYHTVPLASSVSLRAGEKFSVVVKFTSSGSAPVPTEAPVSGYSSQARANAGESYYHADDGTWSQGSTWKDMTSYSPNTNICIKAFTTTSATSGWGEWSSLGGTCFRHQPCRVRAGCKQPRRLRRRHRQRTLAQALPINVRVGQWESLGGYLTSSPAAVSRSAGKITVFVRGSSGSLWSMSTTDGGATWSGWNEIGGQLLDRHQPDRVRLGE